MALRNRVTPFSELVADPARGLVYGNRGCLHDADGEIRRRYAVKRWIACRLEFRGWKRTRLLQPGRFTELFFLDEATAFAAGHRPCALCRYEDYRSFVTIWHKLHPGDEPGPTRSTPACTRSGWIRPRVGSAATRHRSRPCRTGRSSSDGDAAFLVLGDRAAAVDARRIHDEHHAAARAASVLTPPSLVAVLAAGWDGAVPLLHPSASTLPSG